MPNLNKRYLLVSSWDTEERILRTPPKRSKFFRKNVIELFTYQFSLEKDFPEKQENFTWLHLISTVNLGKVPESCWCWRLEQGCWICGSLLVAWWNFPSLSFSTALVPNKYSLVIVLRFFPPCSCLELMPRRFLHLHICRKTLQYRDTWKCSADMQVELTDLWEGFIDETPSQPYSPNPALSKDPINQNPRITQPTLSLYDFKLHHFTSTNQASA